MSLLQTHLFNAVDGQSAIIGLWKQARELLCAGNKLTIELRYYDADKTQKQREYYHGYLLAQIAAKAAPAGEKYAMQAWKELFRKMFLGENGNKRVTVINPMTGEQSFELRRISTEDLGVKTYNDLIAKVTAFATVDLGITLDESIDTWAAQ